MISAVIPVHGRPEVTRTVKSLRDCKFVSEIVVVEALPCTTAAVGVSSSGSWNHDVRYIRTSDSFNKSVLLNLGIAAARTEFVLVSDADIIWNAAAIEGLMEAHGDGLAHVAQVVETDPSLFAPAVTTPMTWRLEQFGEEVRLAIESSAQGGDRGGPGLVLAKRETFLELGGYVEDFQGWGWEDQDLLIRASCLGYRVTQAGAVRHLSHSNDKRHVGTAANLRLSRDRNVARSINGLRAGRLLGPLASPASRHYSSNLRVTTTVNGL